MALIKCPECGKEVSNKAPACIHCGFPLSSAVLENSNISNKEVIYCQILDGISESIFDNGLDEGTEGICKEQNFDYKYFVKNGHVYITRNAGTIEYKIDGDFLVNTNGKEIGMIPDCDTFDATTRSKNFMGGTDVITYKTDGSYSGTVLGTVDIGTYKRMGPIIAKCGSSTGNVPKGFLIYENKIYIASSIKKEKVSIVNNLFVKFNVQSSIHANPSVKTFSTSNLNTPLVKCPYCQSTNTTKISSFDKALNVAAFGIFGNKRKYQWHCNKCKSDF